jgi:predicted TIM-barrel fold metal-dependent hydrolase
MAEALPKSTGNLLGATSSLTEGSSEGIASDSVIPIVDPHQHLWDLKQFSLPWVPKDTKSVLARDYLISDYIEATKSSNVVKAVYMEVDVTPEQHNAEADFVISLCEQGDYPTVGAVISGRPNDKSFPQYMERFESVKWIKGVRQVLHAGGTPRGYCLEPQFVKSVQHLGSIGKCFDLCMRSGELLDGAKLIERCPKTRFVLDHCGNGPVRPENKSDFEVWQKGIREIAKFENVVCKISGIVASAPEGWTASDLEPVIVESMEAFGEDRIMFAGDWPVCLLRASFEQWVKALKTLVKDRSEAFQRKLFHDNAVAFYDLQ